MPNTRGAQYGPNARLGRMSSRFTDATWWFIAAGVCLLLCAVCFLLDDPYDLALNNPTGDFFFGLGRFVFGLAYSLCFFFGWVELMSTRILKILGTVPWFVLAWIVLGIAGAP